METVLPWQQRHTLDLCWLGASKVGTFETSLVEQLHSAIKSHFFGSHGNKKVHALSCDFTVYGVHI